MILKKTMTKTSCNEIKIPSLWYKRKNYKKQDNLQENINIGYNMFMRKNKRKKIYIPKWMDPTNSQDDQIYI